MARRSEKREAITEAWRSGGKAVMDARRSEKREAVTEARSSGRRKRVMERNDRVKTIQTN